MDTIHVYMLAIVVVSLLGSLFSIRVLEDRRKEAMRFRMIARPGHDKYLPRLFFFLTLVSFVPVINTVVFLGIILFIWIFDPRFD